MLEADCKQMLRDGIDRLDEQGYVADSSSADNLCSPHSIARFAEYVKLLLRWSSKVNLVSPGSFADLFERHILDSSTALLVSQSIQSKLLGETAEKIVDVGSGAGLPGIVWSIAARESQFVLVEPRSRRVQFLKEAKRKLGLTNVEIIQSKLEDVSRETLRSTQWAVCRALGNEKSYLDSCRFKLDEGSVVSIMATSQLESIRECKDRFERHNYNYLRVNEELVTRSILTYRL